MYSTCADLKNVLNLPTIKLEEKRTILSKIQPIESTYFLLFYQIFSNFNHIPSDFYNEKIAKTNLKIDEKILNNTFLKKKIKLCY